MSRPCVGEQFEVSIINYTSEGKGVCRVSSYPIFIPFSAVNDKLKIKITKDKKSYFEGEIVEILEKSEDRVEPICESFFECGGCDILHINYDKQIQFKKDTVSNAILKIAKNNELEVSNVIKMEEPLFYRNKAVFNVGKINNKIVVGFYKKKSNEVINTSCCKIIHSKINEVRELVESFCNELNYMPSKVCIKYSFNTDEIMVCLIVDEKKFIYKNELINKLTQIEQVKSIIINYLDKNSVNFGKKSETIFGDDFITETINNIKFKNYLKSFYQVNPIQTKKLYNKAFELLELTKNDTLVDLYCGVGTISLLCAKDVKNVIGVEIIEDAIKSAKDNAIANNVNNCEFILGDAQNILQYVKKYENIKVVVDPPRKGLDEKVIKSINSLDIKTVVYISCNEGTLARDLKIFSELGYKALEITPVDMFCGSHHVENVVKLVK